MCLATSYCSPERGVERRLCGANPENVPAEPRAPRWLCERRCNGECAGYRSLWSGVRGGLDHRSDGGDSFDFVRAVCENLNFGADLDSQGQYRDDAAQAGCLFTPPEKDAAAEMAGYMVQAMCNFGVDAVREAHSRALLDHGSSDLDCDDTADV